MWGSPRDCTQLVSDILKIVFECMIALTNPYFGIESVDSQLDNLDSQEASFEGLMIHHQAKDCTGHTTAYPSLMTSLWKDLIMLLEDAQPEQWVQTRDALLAVPVAAQMEFISEGAKSLRKPLHGEQSVSIKNYGIPYLMDTGKQALLAGQLYSNLSEEELEEWALGLFGVEFQGEYPQCMVISIDVTGKQKARICRLNRSTLWPTDDDFRAFLISQRGDGDPFNSRAVQALFMFMQRSSIRGDKCGTEHLLMGLAEQPNTNASLALSHVGFRVIAAKEQLILEKHSQGEEGSSDPEWFYIFQRAQELAGIYQNEQTDTEHVLLALVQNSCTHAHKLLGLLGINQRLEDHLLHRMRSNAN